MVYKSGVLLITLFIGSLALPTQTSKDIDLFTHVDTSARIVGGTEAAEGSAPYMVALTSGLVIKNLFCGGSLIGPKHVLTAAHCIDSVFIWGMLSLNLLINVGGNDWNYGTQSYTVNRNATYPGWTGPIIKHDIGLLITTFDIQLSAAVSPIQLSFDEAGAGVLAKVSGWGRLETGGSIAAMLQELNVEIIDGQRCIEEVARAGVEFDMTPPPVDPQLEICTFHSPGLGTCNGDSGSALVRRDNQQQIGIVSWGFPCARGAPDMFVRVSVYRDWLLHNLE